MSLDARMMSKTQFVKWAAEEVRRDITLFTLETISAKQHDARMKELAQSVYFHKQARIMMRQAGYIDEI